MRMKQLEAVEFAPEFPSPDRAAIDYAVANGAAKIAHGFISEESLARLQERTPSCAELILIQAPELKQFVDIFQPRTGEEWLADDINGRFLVQTLNRVGHDGQRILRSHQDSSAVPYGVDLLVPVDGPEAFFGASNESFGGDDVPPFVTTYGPGSAILLRQKITMYDRKDVEYAHAWHMGFAAEDRRILSFCYTSVLVEFVEPTNNQT